ncbi:hypothetical protein EGW08_010257, partial [Elysia chlorotica]
IMVVIGVVMIASPLCMFSYYGNLKPYLDSYYNARRGEVSIPVDTLWPTSVFRGTFTLSMIFTSPLELRFGIRPCIVASLVLLWASLMSCYVAVQEPLALVFIFGGTHGFSVGVLYSTSMKLMLQLLADKAGLATGMMSMGPLLGALVNMGVAFAVINPHSKEPDLFVGNKVFFSDPGITERVPNYFLVMGAVVIGTTLLGTIFVFFAKKIDRVQSYKSMSYPQNGELSLRDNDHKQTCLEENRGRTNLVVQAELTPWEALKTVKFYLIWLGYFCTAHVMFLHMDLYKQYGQLAISDDSTLVTTGIIGLAGAIVGRPCVGILSDKIGIRKTALAVSMLSGLFMSLMVISLRRNPWAYVVFVFFEFLCTSPQQLVFSLLTAFELGKTHCASNIGLVSSGNFIIMFLEPLMSDTLINAVGWDWLFLTGSLGGAISFISILVLD